MIFKLPKTKLSAKMMFSNYLSGVQTKYIFRAARTQASYLAYIFFSGSGSELFSTIWRRKLRERKMLPRKPRIPHRGRGRRIPKAPGGWQVSRACLKQKQGGCREDCLEKINWEGLDQGNNCTVRLWKDWTERKTYKWKNEIMTFKSKKVFKKPMLL